MYYFLKHDTFFLPTAENEIFFRNNYTNIKVNVKGSYLLFQKILPFLNGENDLEGIINQIKDTHIQVFYRKLIQSLHDKGFLIKSDSPIYFNKLDELTKVASYYSNGISTQLRDAYENIYICVNSTHSILRNTVVENLVKNNFNVFSDFNKKLPNKIENIVILTSFDDIYTVDTLIKNNMVPYVIYFNKNDMNNELIIKEIDENIDFTYENLISKHLISNQIISYLTSIVELEIIWKWGKLKEPRISHRTYVFNLDKTSGSFI